MGAAFLKKGDLVEHGGCTALVTGIQDGGAAGMLYQIHYLAEDGKTLTKDTKTRLRVQDVRLVRAAPTPGETTTAPAAPPAPPPAATDDVEPTEPA